MPGTVQDLLIHTQDGFENLSADGKFEVVEGPFYSHQPMSNMII